MDAKVKAQVAAVAGPVLVLLGARVLMSPGPVTADASAGVHAVVQQASAPAAPVKLTADQQKILDWCAALPAEPAGSPFVRELFPAVPVPVEAPVTVGEQPPAEIEVASVADLRLSAVMGNSDGGAAIINGKMFTLGAEIRAGVRLTRIDARASRVEVTDSRGQVWRLTCEK